MTAASKPLGAFRRNSVNFTGWILWAFMKLCSLNQRTRGNATSYGVPSNWVVIRTTLANGIDPKFDDRTPGPKLAQKSKAREVHASIRGRAARFPAFFGSIDFRDRRDAAAGAGVEVFHISVGAVLGGNCGRHLREQCPHLARVFLPKPRSARRPPKPPPQRHPRLPTPTPPARKSQARELLDYPALSFLRLLKTFRQDWQD